MKYLLVTMLMLLTGCSHLYWRDTDSVGAKVAKTAVRVPLGVMTLGISEAKIGRAQSYPHRIEYECRQGATSAGVFNQKTFAACMRGHKLEVQR